MRKFYRYPSFFLATLVLSVAFGCGVDETPMTETTTDLEPEEELVVVEPVVDYAVIVNTTTAADFIGREVRLSNLKVASVTGDDTFLVEAEEGGRAMLVRMDEQLAQPEGQIDVAEGDTISLEGVVRAMPPDDALMNDWGVDQQEQEQIDLQTVFIQAESVTKLGA